MNTVTKKKDKAIITDEVWTEDRIRMFLDVEATEGVDVNFHRLLKAYQSMRVEDFKKFIALFKDAGGLIDAKNPQGETLTDIITTHKHSSEYINILS